MLVCSPSTRKFFSNYEKVRIIQGKLTKDFLRFMDTEHDVIAVGGGTVIDAAKIISKNPIVCYPTTAAGSSFTSHSVIWDEQKKISVKRPIPREVIVLEEFLEDLPNLVKEYTTYDVISHCLDSYWSKNSTKESMTYVDSALSIIKRKHTNYELIEAGNFAGKAIEICPTTILHSLSYPLTGIYDIPHGKALGYLLPKVSKFMNFDLESLNISPKINILNLNIERVAKEALKYKKIHDINKVININTLIDILV